MSKLRPGQVSSITDLAEALGVSRQTAHTYVKRPDFPRAVDGVFTVREACRWLFDREAERERSKAILSPSDDPLLTNIGDSPGLERYRMAKAQLAEMDLQVRQGSLIAVDHMDAGLAAITDAYRHGVEEAQRMFGPDIIAIFERAFGRADMVISQYFATTEPEEDGEGDESDGRENGTPPTYAQHAAGDIHNES
jgi:hypothetical protein